MIGEPADVGGTSGVQVRVPSRRERARAATIDEIKQAALTLMREQGTTDFRFSDIARLMGMTAPALYRYFADRDELLTAMIVDAYNDLGAVMADARAKVPRSDPGGRFLALAHTYRRWARAEPERFALILGLPVPGYHAPEEGPTTEAASRAMAQLKALFFEAAEQGVLGRPLLGKVAEAVRSFVSKHHDPVLDDSAPHGPMEHDSDGPPVPPETFQAMLHCWSCMHGFASLEAHGHLDWMPIDVREAIFESGVRLVARAAGLPEPRT